MKKTHVAQNYANYGNFATTTSCVHKPFPLGGGIIHGVRGSVHQFKDYDLSVILASSELPLAVYTMGKDLPKVIHGNYNVIYLPIEDRRAPTPEWAFTWAVEQIIEALKKGKKVGVSCIGAHGRTGTLLACTYGRITGSKDPIKEIRDIHCEDAIEGRQQVVFIHTYLGLEVPPAPPPPPTTYTYTSNPTSHKQGACEGCQKQTGGLLYQWVTVGGKRKAMWLCIGCERGTFKVTTAEIATPVTKDPDAMVVLPDQKPHKKAVCSLNLSDCQNHGLKVVVAYGSVMVVCKDCLEAWNGASSADMM